MLYILYLYFIFAALEYYFKNSGFNLVLNVVQNWTIQILEETESCARARQSARERERARKRKREKKNKTFR